MRDLTRCRTLSKIKTIVFWILLGFSEIFRPSAASAIDQPNLAPSDLSKIHFYLRTAGKGEALYTTGGHSALRYVDESSRTDLVFNWGVFDFTDKDFLLKFLRGDIKYRLVFYPSEFEMQIYRSERRGLVEQEIIFSTEEKARAIGKLKSMLRPEERLFRYHYFFSNCSTKILDVLAEAYGPEFSEKWHKTPAGVTLRQRVRESFSYFLFVQLLLEIVMNGDLDRELTIYEDTFLPHNLQKYLGETGKLSNPISLLTFSPPQPWPLLGIQVYFCFSIVAIGAYLVFRKRISLGKSAFFARLICFLHFSFMASIGTLILAIMTFSVHEHGQRNLNALMFNPFDLVLAFYFFPLGVVVERSPFGRWLDIFQKRFSPIVRWLLLTKILLFVLLMIGSMLIEVRQNSLSVWAYTLPATLFASWLVLFDRPKNNHGGFST